ncbi:MAG: TniQ family protein [Candidatus Thiodiazotropha endolucinida]
MQLLITHPVKNEFSAGHLGRVVRINGGNPSKVPSYKLLKQLELQAFGEISATPMQALASLVGIEPKQYARDHTLLPFHSLAFNSEAGACHGKWTDKHFQRYGMFANNPDVVLCKKCITEDEQAHGFSFWHREHQALGLRTCPHHDVALFHVPGNETLFLSPKAVLSQAIRYKIDLSSVIELETITRYQDMVTLMLSEGSPESFIGLRDLIASRTKSIARAPGIGRIRLISDIVFESFPRQWLLSVFPCTDTEKIGKWCCIFDNAIGDIRNYHLSAPMVAVILSIIFRDAQEIKQMI